MIKKQFQECLACFEAFRKLGYKADDIYFMLSGDENAYEAHMVLMAEDKKFVCDVGPMGGSSEQINTAWEEAVDWWNTTTEENRRAVWFQSHVFKNKLDFLMALHAKGFTPINNKLN